MKKTNLEKNIKIIINDKNTNKPRIIKLEAYDNKALCKIVNKKDKIIWEYIIN